MIVPVNSLGHSNLVVVADFLPGASFDPSSPPVSLLVCSHESPPGRPESAVDNTLVVFRRRVLMDGVSVSENSYDLRELSLDVLIAPVLLMVGVGGDLVVVRACDKDLDWLTVVKILVCVLR